MAIQYVPEIFTKYQSCEKDLFAHDLKMTDNVFKSKVQLSLHMFSFLQIGKKKVHFANDSVAVNDKQSLLIKKGNCLWSELLDNEDVYYCKLLFFSERKLKEFLQKHSRVKPSDVKPSEKEGLSYFVIENDDYLHNYLNSLSAIGNASQPIMHDLLSVKFEELMLYLTHKYGKPFEEFLQSLISEKNAAFKHIIDKNIYSNLNIEELAFLCQMSVSTFKRNFVAEYKASPGKWLQNKRLLKAKELMQEGKVKASDIYLDFGYNNLSNFSAAFKNKFGKSPNLIDS